MMGEQLLGGRIAIPVSGGLDSRCTVAAINGGLPPEELAQRFWAYSYGYSADSLRGKPESRGRCRRRGGSLPTEEFGGNLNPTFFDRVLDPGVESQLEEGFQDLTPYRQAFVVGELGTKSDYVINAHWGDVWLDDMGLTRLNRNEKHKFSDQEVVDHTLRKMAKRGRKWLLENLCTPH